MSAFPKRSAVGKHERSVRQPAGQLVFKRLKWTDALVQSDNQDNSQIYGMTARDILTGANKISMERMPEGLRVFPQTLARYSKRR